MGAVALLGAGAVKADLLTSLAEESLYPDDILLARSTAYQRIVLTKWKDDLRLFLSSHLQFSSRDEYRYHEALVHPALASTTPRRVLVPLAATAVLLGVLVGVAVGVRVGVCVGVSLGVAVGVAVGVLVAV